MITNETTKLTQAILKELFDYDPLTGHLTRKSTGKRAGGFDSSTGYREVNVNNQSYKEHRAIWMWYTGKLPSKYLDHINGDRTDNRVFNLRECTHQQNCQNRTSANYAKTSKYIGVSRYNKSEKWTALIGVNNKQINLGRFNSEEDAYQAYRNAKVKYHTFSPIVNPKVDKLTTV